MTETRPTEIVRIIATNKKYERASMFIAPTLGRDRKPIYGFENIEDISESEKKKMIEALEWTEESAEEIKHLMNLNMGQPRDKALYHWMINCVDFVAKSKNEVNKAKHRFYIENKEEEAKANVGSITTKMQALEIAQKIVGEGTEKIKDACRLLGIPVKGLSPVQATNAFLSHADSSPRVFLNMLDDKFREYKIFIIKLLERGLVVKTKSGSYYHNDPKNVVAINEHQMIAFLQDKTNSTLINLWSEDLGDKRVSKNTIKDESASSSQLSPKDAVNKINELESAKEIEEFIFGEERKQVLNAAKVRTEQLENK